MLPYAATKPEESKHLSIIGDDDSHDSLRAMLSKRGPCKVLDAPSGSGVLTHFLREAGWDVTSADIDRGNFRVDGAHFEEANLNRSLPFADESFDAVVCANGIHRLFNPGAAISEFFRVLRPGGTMYLNVNNYASIDRRLRFLIYGSIADAVNFGPCQQTIDDPEAHVRIAMLYPQIANLLTAHGFEIVSVQAAARRWRQTLLLPLAWGVKAAAMLLPRRRRERDHIHVTASNAICPGGSYLLIEAAKPA